MGSRQSRNSLSLVVLRGRWPTPGHWEVNGIVLVITGPTHSGQCVWTHCTRPSLPRGSCGGGGVLTLRKGVGLHVHHQPLGETHVPLGKGCVPTQDGYRVSLEGKLEPRGLTSWKSPKPSLPLPVRTHPPAHPRCQNLAWPLPGAGLHLTLRSDGKGTPDLPYSHQ